MSRRALAVLALVLVGCERQGPSTAPLTAASQAGSPASTTETPSGSFAFLAPLGTGAADPTRFDAAAAPTVEICAWTGSSCSALPIAVFSTTPSGAILPLVIDAGVGRYEGSWDLLNSRFLTRQTYRIRVLRGTSELGAVSVDVVRGRWALTRSDGTLAPLSAAATLPIRFSILTSTSNQPPAATISAPAQGISFVQGEPIAFNGSATDPEDGPLTGAALVWTSDRDGQFGTGASFNLNTLSVGTHLITLTATDAQGATGSASVSISVTQPTTPGGLANGATVTGRIGAAHQIDQWTFSATAGDHAVLSLGGLTNATGFVPWLRIVDPNGADVISNFGGSAAQVEISALLTGTYKVLVASADAGGFGTADYRLTLIKGPGALTVSSGDQGGVLTNGATASGNLYTGDIDSWTFTAAAGDHAVVSLGETTNSSGLSPWLRIIAPNGLVVGSNFGLSAAQLEFTASVAGSYTVIVGSAAAGFTGTGDYLVTLVKGPGALGVSSGDQGGALTNGATYAGSLYQGDVDGWTFSANVGDRVVISMGKTTNSTGFSPWLRIIGPTGTVVGSNFGNAAAQVEMTAVAAGTYTVVVGSAGAGFTGTGDYLLTLVEAPGGGTLTVSAGDQGGAIPNGATRAGTLYEGDIDAWTFTAGAGDHAVVSLGETINSTGLSPWLRVIGPDGAAVGSNFGLSAAQLELSGLAAGTYVVIVGSAAGGFTGSGDYLLTVVKTPGALTPSAGDQGGALANGATAAGTLYNGDVDGWTFAGTAGDHAIISLGKTTNSSGFSPWLRVVGPTGAVVASNFGSVAAQVEFSVPTSGTYTIVVASAGSGFTGTGDYLLTRIEAPGALTVSTGDHGGALTNGATHAGTLYEGDVDGWTFSANAGDHAVISLGETTSTDLTPWLRVVGPSGAVVGSNFGISAAQVELNNLAAGTYTVVVGSAAGSFAGSGDYLLTLVKTPGTLTVSGGDNGGTLINGLTRTGNLYTGDLDAWTFSASAGDAIGISLTKGITTSGFFPWLRVIGPTGAVIVSNFGSTSAAAAFVAPTSGTYTVIVASAGSGFTGTGDYNILLSGSTASAALRASPTGGRLPPDAP